MIVGSLWLRIHCIPVSLTYSVPPNRLRTSCSELLRAKPAAAKVCSSTLAAAASPPRAGDAGAGAEVRSSLSRARARAAIQPAIQPARRGGQDIGRTCEADQPEENAAAAATLLEAGLQLVCRGTWARVTIEQFRHLALQTF